MIAKAHFLHSPGESLLHRANPLTKLALLIWAATLSFTLTRPLLWFVSALLIALSFSFALGMIVPRRFAILSLPFIVAVFIFHGLILPQPDFVVGSLVRYSPGGLQYAAAVSGRISLILSASLLFVASTHPAELLRAFDTARWSPGLSYLLASPLLLIEELGARTRAIQDAQRTRGLNVEGGLGSRFQSLTVLVTPLITSALSDAHERADVLTARGFRALPYRSVLLPPPDSARQLLLRRLLYLASVLQIGYAFLWR